jgi:ribosomal protein S18 acetylase RimI-like enzyme
MSFILGRFVPDLHARAARALLNDSYVSGAGQTQTFDDWWPALESDAEYDPQLCFIVEDTESGSLAAFAQCWTSGFVKDIAVASSFRRRGLGRAMLHEISGRFAARGCTQLDLKVVADNVPAIHFYKSIGFEIVDGANK